MRFEPGSRVALTFYATLIGFGLRHILDIRGPNTIGHYKWLFFFVAIFLFLRFLLGAANHLWVEYVFPYPMTVQIPKAVYFFVRWDLAFMTTFGCFATVIAYVSTANRIFLLAIVFLAVVFFWGLFDKLLHSIVGLPSKGNWGAWLAIDLGHLVSFAVVWAIQFKPEWQTFAWILITFLSFVALVLDCWVQLNELGRLQ